jgi:predicted dinucleotide-binding enzyme
MTRSICVVGAGIVGANLARAFTSVGHRVVLGARDPLSDKVIAAREELGIDVVSLEHAAEGNDVVVLAVPYMAVSDTVAALGDIGDTVLVDATNTVGTTLPDGAASILDVIAETNPSATLVKGFNTIGAEAFVNPTIDSRALFMPIAGDQPGADLVAELATDIGFDAIVIGDRCTARIVENTAELWIHLAFRTGLGRDFGFTRLER